MLSKGFDDIVLSRTSKKGLRKSRKPQGRASACARRALLSGSLFTLSLAHALSVALLALSPLCNADGSLSEDAARLDAMPTLEEIAYKYGTDKAKDDHKFVDLYMSLFDPIRLKVRNVTEIGIASGQSLQMWIDYFSEAHVWGIDHHVHNTVKHQFENNPRASVKIADAYKIDHSYAEQKLHWANGTMDVIIDDARHELVPNQHLLVALWPFVREGGYYIIEDVGPPSDKIPLARDEPTTWNEQHMRNPEALKIVQENTAFIVDTTFGHRNFSAYANVSIWGLPPFHAQGRLIHNSHLIVLRKRFTAHPPKPWKQFYGSGPGGAMTRDWIFELRRASKTKSESPSDVNR